MKLSIRILIVALVASLVLAAFGGAAEAAALKVTVAQPVTVEAGQNATVKATTSAGASCTRNGVSPKTASSKGAVSWTWTTSSKSVGDYKQTIACTKNGLKGSSFKYLTVVPIGALPLKAPKGFVALTYDDGPFPTRTPRLLYLLKRYNTKATFFLEGQHAEALPNVVKQQVAEGHQVGNHTYDHAHLTRFTAEEQREQLAGTQEIIKGITGTYPTLVRAPYTEHDATTDAIFTELGLTHIDVDWQADPEDWDYAETVWDESDPESWKGKPASQVCSLVVNQARPGSFVLMHEWNSGTVDAVPCIVRGLRAKGLEPGKVVPSATWSEQNSSYAKVVRW